MKDLLVPPKQAVQLKELGFDEPCLFGYNQDDENKLLTAPQLSSYEINSGKNSDVTKINKVTAPFKAQAFKWFREKYNLLGIVGYCDDNSGKFMSVIDKINSDIDYDMNAKDTYEEAEDACLDRLIEIAKDQRK